MAKLDRLGWAAGIVGSCHGVRFGIRSTDAEVLPSILSDLPPGWRPARSGDVVDDLFSLVVGDVAPVRGVRRLHLLYWGAVRLARERQLAGLLGRLASEVRLLVAATAPRRVFVHAGVVGWRGRAVVMCGRSHAGKSTLVAEMLRAGAEYYSDEYAVLSPDGRVWPFAQPLQIRRPEGGEERILPGALGARIGEGGLPIGLVVAAEYRRGAAWDPRRLTPAEGALALLENAVPARLAPRRTLRALRAATAGAACFRGVRGEARDAARAILSGLDDLS